MCDFLGWLMFAVSIALTAIIIVYLIVTLGWWNDYHEISVQYGLSFFGAFFAFIGVMLDTDDCDSQGPITANLIALGVNALIGVLTFAYSKWKDG